MRRPSSRHFFSILIIVIFIFSPAACKKKVHQVSRPMLGTVINLTFIAENTKAPAAAEAVFAEIARIEKLMSPWRRGSDIEVLNRRGSAGPVKVSPETFALVEKSIAISSQTGGAFDITFASMAHLYNYRDRNFRPPADIAVRRALVLVDWRHLRLNKKQKSIAFCRKGVKVGLGGIAKGYAVARGIAVLKEKGIRGAIVEEGGDLQVLGDRYGTPWRAGIRHPRKKDLLAALDLRDGEAIATSGDYERFAKFGGRKFHHIIDPRKGRPAGSSVSVSVVAGDPVTADAFATALFVLGPVEGGKLLAARKDIAAVIVDSELKVYASMSLRGRLEFFDAPEVTWLR